MDLKELKDQLEVDLNKAVISSMALLSRFCLLDDSARNIGPYFDPKYFPFYYHLGKKVSPKSLIHSGFGLGLESGIFLMGCKTVNNFLAHQDPLDQYYSSRIAIKNIKRKYKGKFNCFIGDIHNEEFSDVLKQVEWDMVIVTESKNYEQLRNCYDVLWNSVGYNGLMIVDYVTRQDSNRRAFEDFCKTISRDPLIVNTRYGIGIIEK